MEYAAFRQAGYPIGSGAILAVAPYWRWRHIGGDAIESARKTVAQARMKQSGMRWSRTGAQSMLALHCLLLSQRWDELSTLTPPS